jgi:primase-polymerase (primpol)-like protein
MYVTKKTINEAATQLREVREKIIAPDEISKLNNAIAVLDGVVEASKKVVNSCLRGDGQAAEEFAYRLSGD